jgi:hypothetical protein
LYRGATLPCAGSTRSGGSPCCGGRRAVPGEVTAALPAHSKIRPEPIPLEAFLVSAGVVALAEIGDKTKLLAFILAARFKKPLPIIAGIFCATL